MKSAALRHLLLATGEALAAAYPSRADSLDPVTASLSVASRPDGYHLEWQNSQSGTCQLTVPTQRFAFYARGDVDSLVSKRADGLDLRRENWRAALQTWSEIVGDPDLVRLGDTLDLAARRGSAVNSQPALSGALIELACACICLILAIASTLSDGKLIGAVALTGACSLLVAGFSGPRILNQVSVFGVASGTALVIAPFLELGVGSIRSALFGVCTCSAATVVSNNLRQSPHRWIGCCVAVASSWFAPWPFVAAAVFMLAADIAIASIQPGVKRRANFPALVTLFGVDRSWLAPSAGSAGRPLGLLLVLVVVALSAIRATHGVWSQVSPQTAPAIVATALMPVAHSAVGLLTLSSMGITLALWFGASLRRSTRVIERTEHRPPTASARTPTPIAFGTRR
jgi:hypothetical protein